jgi:hypothetical protein
LGYQLESKGEVWTPNMFGKALKAEPLDKEMPEQIIRGEAELRRKYRVKNYYCTNEGIAAIVKKLELYEFFPKCTLFIILSQ